MSTDTHLINAALKNSTGKPLNLTIKDGSVTNTKLSKDAVSTDKIQNEAVTEEKISSEALKSINDKASEASKEAATKADEARERMEQTMNSMKEVIDSSAIKDDGGNLVPSPFKYVQNKEFIFAMVDAEDKLLAGIQWDGTPVHGKTSSIEDKMQSQIDLIANRVATIIGDEDTTNVIDTMNELKTFFANIENTETLTGILTNLDNVAKNLDKTTIKDEEGNIQDTPFKVIENEEFIHAITDSEDRLLFGIYRETGKPYFPLNEMYHVEQNDEFFAVWLDAADHVLLGIRRDGEIIGEIHAVNALKQVVSQLQSDLATLQEKVGTIDTSLQDLLSVFSLQGNEEYLAVETDADGKVLSSTNPDGSHYIHKVKSETIPTEFEHIEDPEGRMEITTDADGKILGYRDSEGTRHEKALSVDDIILGTKASSYINKENATEIRNFDLPKYGTINILSETFFLTAKAGFYDVNDVYALQINADTDANAQKGLSIKKFYVKSSLKDNGNGTYSLKDDSIPLDFYVPSKVKELDGKYYVLSTLTDSEGNYSINDSSVEVTKIDASPTVGVWSVDKKTEHQCVVDIDFGHYLKGRFYVGVKYQGASTLYVRKRNFRFTFYTNSSFSKKDKKKIGEMIRTNSYNLKANYIDSTRIKEAALYRIFIDMWEKRRKEYHNYPWRNSTTYYDCACGMIKGFPICLSIGGSFYGIYIYGLKKDEKNYRLSSDEDGMFVSGERSDSQCWVDGKPSDWTDEMNDEMTQSNIEALTKFLAFVNGSDFNEDNIPSHLSVIDWIDYFIGMQVFVLKDSNSRNMILYSGKDKTLIYPFFYDLDNSFLFGIQDDIIKTAWASDTSIWKNFKSIYWDAIVTRYKELRQNILTEEYVKKVFAYLEESIPKEDYSKESLRWGDASTNGIDLLMYIFGKRLEWLDENYFI